MRYIKPPDFKSVKEFGKVYKSIESDITDLLTTDASARTASELNALIGKAISAAMSYLTKVNREYTGKELPKAFKEGQDSVSEPKKLSNAEVSSILEKQGFKYAKNGFSKDTYIELQQAAQSAGNGLKKRVNSVIKDLAKTGQDTVYNVQQAIIKDLEQHNVLEVTYSNGAKMSLSAYATMSARSARIESTNIGAIGSALQSGTDLVIMTTMPQCCKLCGAYQDKVYSISGKDKRFPALFKTVLKNGYALPHPNCRHEFIPWYEEIEAPEDVEKAIRKSKIKYDNQGELVDVRHQADIKAYQSWQAGNRQLNRELHEYKQMQAYYERKGEEALYKSLASFRRARRAQAQSYKDNRKEWSRNISTKKPRNIDATAEKPLTLWEQSDKVGKEPNPNAKIDCAVSWAKINNKRHKDKLIGFVGNSTVGKAVANIETKMLKHREGTEQEDIYLLDFRTGKIVGENTTSTTLLETNFSKEMKDLVMEDNEKEYVLVHNHPYSTAPSFVDFNTLYKNPKIKYGIIIGHNGVVYKYKALKQYIPLEDYEIAVIKYKKQGHSEETARQKAREDIIKTFGITWEVLDDGKN